MVSQLQQNAGVKGRVIPFSRDARSRRPGPPPQTPAEPTVSTAADNRELRYAAGRPGRDESGWEGPALDGARVLVLEHDQDTRDALVTTLQQWGAAVSSFTSVAEAVAGLDATAPDAIIAAIRMPGDPYRFVSAVRRHEAARHRHIPMLAIVGDVFDRRRAASAGIHLYVARPLRPARLRLALANLLRAAA